MTENEAIKNINALNAVCGQKDFYDEKFEKSLEMAIKALKEIQQYRAIGTVEECKNSKVIADERYDYLMDDIGLLKRYASIGTIEEFKALKEKSVAKKPIKINMPNTSWCKKQERYECPSCHKYLNFRELSYCCVCGQKLDWQ